MRNLTRRGRMRPSRREPHRFASGPLELPRYELGSEVATRKAYGDALAALGEARGDVVALDGEVSNSTFAEIFARSSRTASSRCSSPSSSWSRRRSGCRCAAGGRSPRRSRRSSRARTTSSAWRRSAARRTRCAARTPASRSARTGRRRWRSRISPRSGPCTARPCSIPSDANQTAKLVATMADLDGISYMRTTRANTPVIYGPDEEFPSAERGSCAPRRRRGDDRRAPGSRCTRRSRRRTRSPGRA